MCCCCLLSCIARVSSSHSHHTYFFGFSLLPLVVVMRWVTASHNCWGEKKFHISALHDKDWEKGLDCLIISRDMEMTCTKLNYKSFSCCVAALVCAVERACLSEGKKGKKLDSGKVSEDDDDVVCSATATPSLLFACKFYWCTAKASSAFIAVELLTLIIQLSAVLYFLISWLSRQQRNFVVCRVKSLVYQISNRISAKPIQPMLFVF